MENFQDKFEKYLTDEIGVSRNTLKFYRSDFYHFSGWFILKAKTLGIATDRIEELLPLLSKSLASAYRNFLEQNNIPPKTVNRRLSTLRHLAKFLTAIQILDFDFMEGQNNLNISKSAHIVQTTNSNSLILNFRKHLEQNKASKNTIKNYLSDIKQFISWLEGQDFRTS